MAIRRRLDSQPLDHLTRIRFLFPEIGKTERQSVLPEFGETDVVPDIQIDQQAMLFSVFGDQRHPLTDRFHRRTQIDRLTIQFDFTRDRWIDSKQRLQEFGPTTSHQPCDPHNLASPNLEGNFLRWPA